MADIKHAESDDPGNSAFDHFNQVLQDIREIREKHDSRSLPHLHARAAAAESESHSDESLPLFLAATDDHGRQPADQDPEQDTWPQVTWRQNTLLRETPQQAARRQDALQQDAWPQDAGLRTLGLRTLGRGRLATGRPAARRLACKKRYSTQPQGSWLHAAAKADRRRIKAVVAPTALRRVLKTAVLVASVLAVAAAVFAMEDRRAVIASASASLAAVLPTLSGSVGQPAPANEQIAAIRVAPMTTAAVPAAREATAGGADP